MILGSLLSVIATPPGRRDRAGAAPIAGLADNTPGRTPRREVGRRQASHLDKQVEPGIGPMEKVPRTRLQIGEPQHASKTNAPALEHALPAQRRGGLGEPPPDLVVHDRAEQNMPPPAAIERLTAAIADIGWIGAAHRPFAFGALAVFNRSISCCHSRAAAAVSGATPINPAAFSP